MSSAPSPSVSELDALLNLISSSVNVVKTEYAKFGYAIPSLDSTTPHPLDAKLPGLELKRAVQTLEGACAQLTAIVAPPAHTIVNVGSMTLTLVKVNVTSTFSEGWAYVFSM